MKKIMLISVLAFTGTLASSQMLGDLGFNPLQAYQAGYHQVGAFDVHNPLYCSPTARLRDLPEALPSLYVFQLKSGFITNVQQQTQAVNQVINKTFSDLNSQGDPTVQRRHVCTGFFVDGSEGGNAFSKVNGYLIFDYKLFQRLLELPDHLRSLWVLDFLILHEFAHQIQFWLNDVEVIRTLNQEQSSKRAELAADCLAGAFIRWQNIDYSQMDIENAIRGIQGAASILGDFEFFNPTHHGTPVEREFATLFGMSLINTNSSVITSPFSSLTSQYLLQQCNQFVDQYLD